MSKTNNISFKGIEQGQIAVRNILCERDLCRNTIRKNPDTSFFKTFQSALKESMGDSKPIFVFENPYYLSMLEKLKRIKSAEYCQEWLTGHIEKLYGVDLNKDPINHFCLTGKDKIDYIKFFTRWNEREYITPFGEELERKGFSLLHKSFKDNGLENGIITQLDKNDDYQNKFYRFLEPRGIKIENPHPREGIPTFLEGLAIMFGFPKN